MLNVRFLENPNNEVSLYRSKAVGEPPLLLGICVWTAAKNAISSFGDAESAKISLPATGRSC